MLLGAARMIGEQVHLEEGVVQVIIPPAALELFVSPSRDRVFYRVSTHDGQLLSGYFDFAPPTQSLLPEEFVYSDVEQRGKRIHTVAFAQPFFSAPERGPVIIQVGQTLDGRNELARDIWVSAIRSQFALFPLLALLLWFGMRRGMRPLIDLRDRMRNRAPGALDPLDTHAVPTEIEPLVSALNDYVGRLDSNMSAHSRFIADASHQLRTPLTLLNTQVVYALRQVDASARTEVLLAMHASVQQSVRLVNQLLAFTMAQAGIGHPPAQVEVDLQGVVRKVMEAQALAAQERDMDFGFEAQIEYAIVLATPLLLHELVANLVDNALRYTQRGGRVTARVCQIENCVALQIEDNGPGIPLEQHEKVFERFYRLDDSRSDGCGLGLSIVREIAQACNARIELSTPVGGAGLLVTVLFRAPLQKELPGLQRATPH